MELNKLITELCGIMSVSGQELRNERKIRTMFGEFFDEIKTDNVGNILLIKKCGRENAVRILVDTHFDEIGFLVNGVHNGGFLSFINVGGVDPAILQAAEVIVYGSEEIRGIITSIPPHLRSSEDGGKYRDIDKLYIDTGFSKEEIEKIAPVGTSAGFAPVYTELEYGKLCGKSFDNKACAAAAISAVVDTAPERLAGDVYILLSSFEETSHEGGVVAAGFAVKPDYALVIDVNLAAVPDVPKRETVAMGKGVSVSISAVTDRKLTNAVISMCEDIEIKHTKAVSAASTGTNAVSLNLVGEGIPVCDIGLPLKGMHTYSEVLSVLDAAELARFVGGFITSEKIAKEFGNGF